MPRYHFNLRNRMGFLKDEEGREMPGIDAARAFALSAIRDIISEEVKAGLLDLRGRLEITDGSADILAVITFDEAFEIHLREGPP